VSSAGETSVSGGRSRPAVPRTRLRLHRVWGPDLPSHGRGSLVPRSTISGTRRSVTVPAASTVVVWYGCGSLQGARHAPYERVVMPEYTAATAGASGITPVVAGLVSLVVWIVSMYFARKIAIGKGRSPWLGLILGFVLSWIGLIIVALLPRRSPRTAPATAGFRESAPQPPWATRATQSTPPPFPPAAPAADEPQAAPPAPDVAPPVPQAAPQGSTAPEEPPPAPLTLRVVPPPPPDDGPQDPRPPEV
jgi:hypothetical protein